MVGITIEVCSVGYLTGVLNAVKVRGVGKKVLRSRKMEKWNDQSTSVSKRILILVRDKYNGECSVIYKKIAEEVSAGEAVVAATISRLISRGVLTRTAFGIVLPK